MYLCMYSMFVCRLCMSWSWWVVVGGGGGGGGGGV